MTIYCVRRYEDDFSQLVTVLLLVCRCYESRHQRLPRKLTKEVRKEGNGLEEGGRGKGEKRNEGIREGGLGRRNISKNGGKELERERGRVKDGKEGTKR